MFRIFTLLDILVAFCHTFTWLSCEFSVIISLDLSISDVDSFIIPGTPIMDY